MRPSRFIRAVGLIEPSTLQVFLTARFNQNKRTLLGAVVNSAVRERDGAFGHAALVRIPFVPQNLTRLEVKTSRIASTIAAIGAEQGAIVENHPAMMIFHRLREPDFLRGELPGLLLNQSG